MTGLCNLFPIERSDYYKRWLLEQNEIDRVQWLESEREGHSIDRERAEWIWMTRYRNGWLRSLASGIKP